MVQGTRHDQTMVCHGDVVAVWLQEAADIFPLCLHRVVGNVEESVVISNSVRDETGVDIKNADDALRTSLRKAASPFKD